MKKKCHFQHIASTASVLFRKRLDLSQQVHANQLTLVLKTDAMLTIALHTPCDSNAEIHIFP